MAFTFFRCVLISSLALSFLHLCSAFVSPFKSTLRASPKLLRRDEHPCGQLFDVIGSATDGNPPLFDASDVYACLTNVPFHPDPAKQLLQYYRDTLQFHSTLAYLRDPPASYEPPAVDLLGGITLLENDIDLGIFENQYAFEAALQTLIYAAHDYHLLFIGGALSVFTFASPLEIVSLSPDGVSLPKLYITSDIEQAFNNYTSWSPETVINPGPGQFVASAVTSINNENVTDFLSRFASLNVFGNRDSNTDYNTLMFSPAGDIQDFHTGFQGSSPFYYGDIIDFGFENGTSTGALDWVAIPTNPEDRPAIKDGDDFYTYYVLGESLPDAAATASATAAPSSAPASAAATASAGSSGAATATAAASTSTQDPQFLVGPSAISWSNPAYPIADISQFSLGDGGWVSGYFLNDSKTAVLSIPSFDQTGDAVFEFSNTVHEFLNLASQNGMAKIVVDVSQNYGGQPLLALDTYRQFFPNLNAFAGSRGRAQNYSNTLGLAYTTYYQSLTPSDPDYVYLAASPWVATDYINVQNGQNFSSWQEYYGPQSDHYDNFTLTQQDNLTSSIYDKAATDGLNVYGYGQRPADPSNPLYQAEDIIILTDSICHSACTIFTEAMHHDAGVRTVAVGGLPRNGAMQAQGGTRGALAYTASNIDDDFSVLEGPGPGIPDRNLSYWLQYGGITLHDQIRQGEDFPLQFAYEPADCRIFFSAANFLNFTALWQNAADAIWKDSSLCVPGSTITAGQNSINESATTKQPSFSNNGTDVDTRSDPESGDLFAFLASSHQEDGRSSNSQSFGQPCTSSCSGTLSCRSIFACTKQANGASTDQPHNVCLRSCATNSDCSSPYADGTKFTCDTSDSGDSRGNRGVCKQLSRPVCNTQRRTQNPFEGSTGSSFGRGTGGKRKGPKKATGGSGASTGGGQAAGQKESYSGSIAKVMGIV